MNLYLDSSVVLRKILGQPNQLSNWSKIKSGFSSRLMRLECLRTFDRMHQAGLLTTPFLAECRSRFFLLLDHVGLIPLTEEVLDRAEGSFTTPLGSLDSIHLVTALLWRKKTGRRFFFATHDSQLALAARAHGFEVLDAR